MDNPKPKKLPKPRSLPPPGEAFEKASPKAKVKAIPKARGAAKEPAASKKAPPKLKPSAAKSTDGGQSAGQVKAGNGVTKPAPAKKGKQAKVKTPSMWDFIKHESVGVSGSFSASRKKVERESVLVRPTAMTAHLKAKQAGGTATKKVAKPSVKTEAKAEAKVFRIMDLLEELRAMIWREAVVYPHFVWPGEDRGREQPDLAMTCRQVREEVLPIFYTENIFAIDITRFSEKAVYKGGKTASGVTGIAAIPRWANALGGTADKPDWFSMIRKWSFSYLPDNRTKPSMVPGIACSGKVDSDAVVSVAFSKKQQLGGMFWDANVEIHRSSFCLLPMQGGFGSCKVQTVPEWLNEPVIAVTEAAKGGKIDHKMITELAKRIMARVDRLCELRCEEI